LSLCVDAPCSIFGNTSRIFMFLLGMQDMSHIFNIFYEGVFNDYTMSKSHVLSNNTSIELV
jgi:hypothetical protein